MASSAIDKFNSRMARFNARLEKTKEANEKKNDVTTEIEEIKNVEIVKEPDVTIKESGKSRILRFSCK